MRIYVVRKRSESAEIVRRRRRSGCCERMHVATSLFPSEVLQFVLWTVNSIQYDFHFLRLIITLLSQCPHPPPLLDAFKFLPFPPRSLPPRQQQRRRLHTPFFTYNNNHDTLLFQYHGTATLYNNEKRRQRVKSRHDVK